MHFHFIIKSLNLSSFLIFSKSLACLADSMYSLSLSIAFFRSAKAFSVSPFLALIDALINKAIARFGFSSIALS